MTHTRSISRSVLALVALVLVLCPLFMLTGCFGMKQPPQIAAHVNGVAIPEDKVTEFIEGFRSKNAQYETDSGWAEFLKSNGYTSETLRTYVLNTVFIPQELIRQECAKLGIQIGDTELDEVIKQEKSYYEQRYGENSWDSVLASYGYDEESWRENELNRLLEEQLRSMVIDAVTPTEAEIQAQANESASMYNGKDSYYIQFASQQEAQAARDRIAASSERVTLGEFERLGNAVHAGWNSLPSTRDAMSVEYIQAVGALDVDTVSEPIMIDGNWTLIFCDAAFNVGAGGESVVLRTIPPDIYEQIVADATEIKADQLFNEWLQKLAAESDITIEPMPVGLPYNVSSTYLE